MPRTFILNVTPTLDATLDNAALTVITKDDERAREIALRLLARTPDALLIDIVEHGQAICTVTRDLRREPSRPSPLQDVGGDGEQG